MKRLPKEGFEKLFFAVVFDFLRMKSINSMISYIIDSILNILRMIESLNLGNPFEIWFLALRLYRTHVYLDHNNPQLELVIVVRSLALKIRWNVIVNMNFAS